MPVLADFSLQIENHRAVRFASKRLLNRQENLLLCPILPSRQTLPRHTGTPPVSQSDELSILLRFSVLISDSVSKRLLFVTQLFFFFSPKLCS